MDFSKTLLLNIVSLSFLLLSGNAVPLTDILHVSPSIAPVSEVALQGGSSFLVNTALPEIIRPEVKEFCGGTENPTLCAETMSPFLQGSFDPIKALETEIQATLNQSLKVVGIIGELLDDPNTAKMALDALDICKSQYKNMVDTIKDASELLGQQNVADAYYKFSSVLSDRSACEDAFVETPGVDIPFAKDSDEVSQLGGNCMTIMDGIVNRGSIF